MKLNLTDNKLNTAHTTCQCYIYSVKKVFSSCSSSLKEILCIIILDTRRRVFTSMNLKCQFPAALIETHIRANESDL